MKINFKDKGTIILLIILTLVTTLTAGIGFYYFSTKSEGIAVEDFTGKTVQEVMTWADANNLNENQIEYVYQYDENVNLDTVLSQSMDKDALLKEEDKIIFTVSKGYDKDLVVSFPDFSTMNKDQISQFFEENKFSDVTFEYATDKKVAKDGFIKININGDEAKRSDLIVVTISIGKENVGLDIVMPDFSNESKANIKAWADTNNITVTFKTESSESIASGKVISQSVKAGEIIQTGDKISITLSSGKGIVLKDFAGKKKEDVEAWAKENNAKVEYISYYADSTEKDKVISTTPKSGNITASTTVKVYLSLGSVKTIDFTGKKEADVKKWLDEQINKNIYDKNNYIQLKVLTDNTSDKEAGTIIKTNPSKDETIKLQGTLTITVAGNKQVEVSSKSNITVDELKTYLEGLGMKLGTKTKEIFSDTVASGKVISNDSGKKQTGTLINYVISKGVFKPDNKYSSLSACKTSISQEGVTSDWSCQTKEEYHDSIAANTVIRQEVSGKTITLIISKGKGITVKDYIGQTAPCSKDSCSYDGLSIKIVSEYNSSVEKGKVIKQSITKGTIVNSGTTITLTVSKGPQPTATPAPTPTPTPVPTPTPTPTPVPTPTPTPVPTPTPDNRIEIPSLNLDLLSAYGNYDAAKSNIINVLANAGFTNVEIIKLSGDDNPNDYIGIIDSYTPNTGKVDKNTKITVKIFGD